MSVDVSATLGRRLSHAVSPGLLYAIGAGEKSHCPIVPTLPPALPCHCPRFWTHLNRYFAGTPYAWAERSTLPQPDAAGKRIPTMRQTAA